MTVEIPGYKIERILGKGGMATVYLAVQDIFERQVALKVMSTHLMETRESRERFLQEARITSRLMHPNIVSVYDVGLHKGHCYLAMEFVDGLDLKKARKSLSMRERLNVVIDIAKALEYASHKGYVHRDIKPENIMLSGVDKRAVLMDFGIARTVESDLSLTQTGTAIGTPHYMSPEQAKGHKVDIRSDIYSLGIVLYYLLIGKVPFEADSAVAIGIKHLTDPIPTLPPEVSALQPIFSRMLEKNPDDRYQTPTELLVDLKDVDTDELRMVKSLSGKYKTGKSKRRRNKKAAETSVLIYWAMGALCLIMVSAFGLKLWYDKSNQLPPVVITVETPALDQEPSTKGVRGFVDNIKRWVTGANAEQTSVSRPAPAIDVKEQGTAPSSPGAELEHLIRTVSSGEANEDQRSQLSQIINKEFKAINKAFDKREFEQAAQLFEPFERNYGRIEKSKIKVFKSRYKYRQELETLLARADEKFSAGKLVSADGRGALGDYQEVLDIDEGIEHAKKRVATIANIILEQAREKYLSGDTSEATTLAQKVLRIEPRNESAKGILQRIEDDKRIKFESSGDLAKADYYLNKGQLYSPEMANAFFFYQRAIQNASTTEQALKGLERVNRALVDRMDRLIAKHKFEEARALLDEASQARGLDGRMQLLLFRVDEAESQYRINNNLNDLSDNR